MSDGSELVALQILLIPLDDADHDYPEKVPDKRKDNDPEDAMFLREVKL